MGVGCCIKVYHTRKLVLQNNTSQQSLEDFRLYYKLNKVSMHQKVKNIYKQISKEGSYNSDVINLNFVNLQKTRAKILLQLFPYFQNLKTLKLWKSQLGSEGMKYISTDLGNLENLEVLSLEENNIGPDGCMYLSTALKKMRVLKELWLHINDIGTVGASCIADVVGKLSNLEKLGLDENSMENKGAFKIVSSIKNLKNLKMLGFGNNLLTEDACLNIIVMLREMDLEKFILSGNCINEETHSKVISLMPKTLIIF